MPKPAAAALAAGYFGAAWLGLYWAQVEGAASPIWPAAGIALAGLLLGGLRLAPAVFVGCLAAFALAGRLDLPVYASISAGNTVAALGAAWLLTRRAGFDRRLREPRDALALAAVGTSFAALSAAFGIGSLHAAGVLPASEAFRAGALWWLGDTLGVLTLTPLLLAWGTGRFARLGSPRLRLRFGAVLFATTLLTALVFVQEPPGWLRPWAVMPASIAAAFAFGVPGATASTAVIALLAVPATTLGLGPFAGDGDFTWLYLAQFLVATALVGLLLAIAARGRVAQRALQASEARLRELADAIPQIVSVASGDGRPAYANRRAAEYFGAVLGAGGDWVARVHPDDRETLRARWKAALAAREPMQAELRLQGHDGGYRWFLARSVPVLGADGQVVRWYGTSTDIDARKRAEERLRLLALAGERLAEPATGESGEPTGEMLERIVRMIVPAHADWAIVYASQGTRADDLRAWRARHARPELQPVLEELARDGGPGGAAARDSPGHPLARLVANAFATGEPRLVREIGREDADAGRAVGAAERESRERLGTRSLIVLPLVARDRTFGVLAMARAAPGEADDRYDEDDFTFARELARRCALALDRAALAATAQRALAELRAADRRKDEFLATLAHELRNPLAPLRNALRVLRLAGHDPAVAGPACEMMERQLGQLVRLVDDLLDVSRIATAKLHLKRERVELGEVIARALEMARPNVEAAGHRLVIDLHREPVWLDADPVRLAQVLVNLLNNAAKYGGVAGTVRLAVERPGGAPDRVRVAVSDTGIGIPAEALGRVFDLFAQVEHGREHAQGGLGIGLSLARRLVELHGGRIEAASPGAGLGSTFTVELPVAAAAVAAPAPPAKPAEPAGPAPLPPGHCRVLVADDNRDAADSLAAWLRLAGHEVVVAYDGREALEAYERERPNVLLLDIGMPVLDGYAVARRVRESPGGATRVLVATTGWGQPEDRRRARDAGFDHHYTKPVDAERLEALLAGLHCVPADRRVRPPFDFGSRAPTSAERSLE